MDRRNTIQKSLIEKQKSCEKFNLRRKAQVQSPNLPFFPKTKQNFEDREIKYVFIELRLETFVEIAKNCQKEKCNSGLKERFYWHSKNKNSEKSLYSNNLLLWIFFGGLPIILVLGKKGFFLRKTEDFWWVVFDWWWIESCFDWQRSCWWKRGFFLRIKGFFAENEIGFFPKIKDFFLKKNLFLIENEMSGLRLFGSNSCGLRLIGDWAIIWTWMGVFSSIGFWWGFWRHDDLWSKMIYIRSLM